MSSARACLRPAEARRLRPDPAPADHRESLQHARRAMQRTGQWSVNQQMGRRWPIGCVALEITQRCNLDCGLCYLSEASEAVRDVPLAELLGRIERIFHYYGPGTDVQITGGDPTLRRHDELCAVVARVAELGMRPTLMTNGIKADRPLLARLARAGLADVAFHVDSTQQRKGYTGERSLNRLRRRCIEAAEGLGINIMFNTTVYGGNIDRLDDILAFFRANARRLRLVSFQVQADTGRGTERGRPDAVAAAPVWRRIERFLGTSLNGDAIRAGHAACSRYGIAAVVGRRSFDLLDEPDNIGRMLAALAGVRIDRVRPTRTALAVAGALALRPRTAARTIAWALRKSRTLVRGVIAERRLPTTLSFMVHSFMDACALDAERLEACAFKVMTHQGPLSMCLHNARRDEFILAPLPIDGAGEQPLFWNPLSGQLQASRPEPVRLTSRQLPLKRLKGRARRAALRGR